MRLPAFPAPRLVLPLVAVACLALSTSGLAERPKDAPSYAPSQVGLEHFIQDQLPGLLAGKTWTWEGSSYQTIRMHRILKNTKVSERQAGRDYLAGARAWTVATVHVRVDGELRSGKVVINSSYAWEPATWVFDEALLEMGRGVSFDFVKRELR